MPTRLYIPREVKEQIRQHLDAAVERAAGGYGSAKEEEDALTGQLGILLKIAAQRVQVSSQQELGGVWTWSIDYFKFRGRGANATEKLLGADGIFELRLNRGWREERKSLLFQAKNNWDYDRHLFEQCVKLSTWREATFVVNYGPGSIAAYPIDSAIKSRGRKPTGSLGIPLGSFLGNNFLECLVGSTDLYFDAKQRMLVWRAINQEMVATRFSLGHRLMVRVNAPKQQGVTSQKIDREIPNEQIHDYRIDATPEDILSVDLDCTQKDASRAMRQLAATYHPDAYSEMLNDLLKGILTRRAQEVNDAYVKIRARTEKKPSR